MPASLQPAARQTAPMFQNPVTAYVSRWTGMPYIGRFVWPRSGQRAAAVDERNASSKSLRRCFRHRRLAHRPASTARVWARRLIPPCG